MKKEIINRLEYVEETYAGELETWQDPVTKTYYHVPIEITRRWDESEALESDKPKTMTHERKEEHESAGFQSQGFQRVVSRRVH